MNKLSRTSQEKPSSSFSMGDGAEGMVREEHKSTIEMGFYILMKIYSSPLLLQSSFREIYKLPSSPGLLLRAWPEIS